MSKKAIAISIDNVVAMSIVNRHLRTDPTGKTRLIDSSDVVTSFTGKGMISGGVRNVPNTLEKRDQLKFTMSDDVSEYSGVCSGEALRELREAKAVEASDRIEASTN